MNKKIISIICALCLVLSLGIKSFAEFGDFAGDNDFGGGWDSGGYDYDYDNDYDYDYDYDDDNDYNYDDDDDDYESYNSYFQYAGYTGGGGNSGGLLLLSAAGELLKITPMLFSSSPDDDGGTSVVGVTMLACVIAIIAVVVRRKKSAYSSPKRDAYVDAGAQPTDASTLKDIGAFKDIDPEFSEAEFCSNISNMYVKFQNAWQSKNIEELRPYLTDEFYARMDRQLDAYRRNHQTNMVERIAVLGTDIKGWKREKENDVIVVRLKTRIVDYVVDDKTQQVIRGSRTAEKFMEYEWSLSRKAGVKTGVDSGIRVVNCPNCGAPLNISKTAKCEYCDSIVTVDSTDWVVTEMKGISQRTNGR